jgi:hypothetical protein
MRLFSPRVIANYFLEIRKSINHCFWGGNMFNENLINSHGNPIPELINDEVYSLLHRRGLINEKSVRDYLIKKRFKNLRDSKIRASEAIDSLREEYPYLQFDTIRKIVYQT